jgi:hypothetical protein
VGDDAGVPLAQHPGDVAAAEEKAGEVEKR